MLKIMKQSPRVYRLAALLFLVVLFGSGAASALDLDLLSRLRNSILGPPANEKLTPRATASKSRLSVRTSATVSAADTLWFDDATPLGAIQASDGEGWNWVNTSPAPFSGSLAHQSGSLNGLHQHYFQGASSSLALAVGDTLFAYVYLDPANPPSEVMLQWNDGSWDHRAYWGSNSIQWGVDGTSSRRFMGALPPAGQWVRLEVPASLVGLQGRTVNGMAFTLFNGRATWDFAGKTAGATISGAATTNGLSLRGVNFDAGAGTACSPSDALGQYSCTVPQGYSGTVTPSFAGYTFSPPSRSYSNIVANQTAQDFAVVAAPLSLTGTVNSNGLPVAGVSFTATNGGSCAESNSLGQYSCIVPLAWSGEVVPALSGYIFSPTSRAYNGVSADQAAQNYAATAISSDNETVWVEDAPPPGSSLAGAGENWTWVSSAPTPFSGTLAHQSASLNGIHQHYFTNASVPLTVAAGNSLFAYVYLDPTNPPTEVMLQWNDGSWEHRAYWGFNSIAWGVDGTASRRFMGALPPTGQWVRLEVPASLVGLEGRTVTGMAYTLFNGRATWDRAGQTSAQSSTFMLSGTVTLNSAPLVGAVLTASNGGACTASNASGQYSCTVSSNWSGTVSPVLAGYSFLPASRSYSNVAANQFTQDFAASATALLISGTVTANSAPLAGVALTATNGGACTASNASGQYNCSVPVGWSGTLTPALVGHTFSPPSRNYSSIAANQPGQDFSATVPTFQIGGVVSVNNVPLPGVSFAATAGVCTISDASGQYSCTVPFNWSGTVTAALNGYTFIPPARPYTNVTTNQSGQNYAASANSTEVPTFVGASSAPADNVAQPVPTVAVVPPAGMAPGDLVVMFVQTTPVGTRDITVQNTGGQVWSTSDATYSPTFNIYLRVFWARFNGTWSASPSVTLVTSATIPPMTIQMLAFRATAANKWWVPDNWAYSGSGFPATSAPFTATLAGITTLKPETVAIAAWATPTATTWGSLAGANWTQSGLSPQYRNTSGDGQSLAVAYQTRSTPGATGSVSLNQMNGVGQAGASYVISFAAVDLPQGGIPGPLTRVQSKSMQGGGGQSTMSLTFDAPIGNGNAVMGYIYFETSSTRISGPIVDDMGNEYTVVQMVDTTAATQGGITFFRPNITNAPRTITITVQGRGGELFRWAGLLAHEVSGALALDKYSGFSLPSGDAFSPGVISAGPVTTTTNGSYIFCVAETVALSPPIPFFNFSGWASARVVEERRTSESSNTFASGDTVQATAGPIECTAAINRGTEAFIMMMAFKPLP